MKYYTHKQIFYIDTFFRLNPSTETTSNFTFSLPIDTNAEYDSITLLDAVIPKTNYSINERNNKFLLVEEFGSREIVLPIGNYSKKGFINAILPVLNIQGGPKYSITIPNLSLNCDNGKYSFFCDSSYQPSFVFDDNKCLCNHMGFYSNQTYTFVNGRLDSARVINFKVRDSFLILSDIVSDKNDNVLCHLTGNSYMSYDYINFKNMAPMEYSKKISHSSANIYSFTIVDEEYIPIDLNGIDVYFSVMIYKSNNIDSLLKGFIKYQTMKE